MVGTKVTMFFQNSSYGWTETYYLPTASAGFLTEFSLAINLATKRAAMLGREASIIGIRYANLAGGRLAFTDNSALNFPMKGDTAYASDFSDTAILLQLIANSAQKTGRRFLRGNWDEIVDNGGHFNPLSTWKAAAYIPFKNLLINRANGWSFVAKDNAASVNGVVSNVVQNGDGTARVTTSVGTWATDPNIRYELFISGVGGSATINGLGLFQGIAGGTGTQLDSVRKIAVLPFTNQGKFAYRVMTMYPIDETALTRVGERKAGRPLPPVPGRRPNRVRG